MNECVRRVIGSGWVRVRVRVGMNGRVGGWLSAGYVFAYLFALVICRSTGGVLWRGEARLLVFLSRRVLAFFTVPLV